MEILAQSPVVIKKEKEALHKSISFSQERAAKLVKKASTKPNSGAPSMRGNNSPAKITKPNSGVPSMRGNDSPGKIYNPDNLPYDEYKPQIAEIKQTYFSQKVSRNASPVDTRPAN